MMFLIMLMYFYWKSMESNLARVVNELVYYSVVNDTLNNISDCVYRFVRHGKRYAIYDSVSFPVVTSVDASVSYSVNNLLINKK